MADQEATKEGGELKLSKLMMKFGITSLSVIEEFLILKATQYGSIDDKVASMIDFAETNFPIRPPQGKSNEISDEYRATGNLFYIQSRNFDNALRYYNLAVGQAEDSSVEIAMAYANRSAINFESGRFEDAVIDIDRALLGKYPAKLKFKILERKSQCLVKLQNYTAAISSYKEAIESLAFLNVSDDKRSELKRHIEREMANIKDNKDVDKKDVKKALKLSASPSEIIYCSSEAVRIDFTPSSGRFVVATKNIRIGDVLAIEKAYASDLEEKHLLTYCYHCKKKCFSMLPCLKCTEVFYCDENCRTKSWDTEHMTECDIMSTINNIGLGSILKVLLKMTKQGRKLQKFFDKEEQYRESNKPFPGFKNDKYSADTTAIMNLYFNENLFNSNNVAIIALHACIFVSALKKTDFFSFVRNQEDMHLKVGRMLTKIICQAKSNVFGYGGCKNVTVGNAFMPFMSLLEHSCDPNCFMTTYEKDTCFLIAVDPIAKGQQISISYGPDFYMAESERQRIFQSRGFACKCYGCERNWPPADRMPNPGLLKSRVSIKLIDECIEEFRDFYKFYLQEIQEGGNVFYLKQSHLDSTIRVAVNLNKHLRKPSQILYGCKRLIMSMIYDLIQTNSLKLK